MCYYILKVRDGAGAPEESWVMFISHTGLLCALLVCSLVDIERWIVPLEVCWFVSILGVLCSGVSAHPWMPKISPQTGAMAVGAAAGLIVALVLVHYGLIQRSFIDATEPPAPEPPRKKKKKEKKHKTTPTTCIAITAQSGVNPRKEILREVLFLAPAFILASGMYVLVTYVPAAAKIWTFLVSNWRFAAHFNGVLAAMFGYLIGGLWIWGARILGTLGFGKEAMGLGDVHILAAVGAVTGWIVPSIAFFVAPFFGLLWAIYLFTRRNQHELPYGPWLAIATLVIMLTYDRLEYLLSPYAQVIQSLVK